MSERCSTLFVNKAKMDFHCEKLSSICRMCGESLAVGQFKRRVSQHNWCVKKVYKIDINEDKGDIHPAFVCRKCDARLRRYKEVWTKKRKAPDNIPDMYLFRAHSDGHCSVCGKFSNIDKNTRDERDKNEANLGDSKLADTEELTGEIPSTSKATARKSLSFEEEGQGAANTVPSAVPSVLITSFATERFKAEKMAEIVACCICKGVPTCPCSTPCGNIFCRTCLQAWLAGFNTCPICREPLEEQYLTDLKGSVSQLYDCLTLTCSNSSKGCSFINNIPHMIENEESCNASLPRKMRGPGLKKKSLQDSKSYYANQVRLKDCIDSVTPIIDKFCTERKEDKNDVMFCLLINHLNKINENTKSMNVKKVWTGASDSIQLTSDESLSIRVDTLQSKKQYKTQYDFFKSLEKLKHVNPLATPYSVNKAEIGYMPASVRFSVEGDNPGGSYYHTPIKPPTAGTSFSSGIGGNVEPINLMDDFYPGVPEVHSPNMCAVRWNYVEALAKTLEELDPEVDRNLTANNLSANEILTVTVKDGADGLGDISIYKQVGDRTLPNKAFRASFCVLYIYIVNEDGKKLYLFENDKPNSIRTNRPYLQGIADENDRASSITCLVPMESEREYLRNKVLKVEGESGWKKYRLDFHNSMIDEKLDRKEGGLAGSGSNYLCTLCYATRSSAKEDLGSFKICRSRDETVKIAQYIQLNPDKLSPSEMDKIAKGVKSMPILMSDPSHKGIDATHADINNGRFIKNLLCREIACVTSQAIMPESFLTRKMKNTFFS